MFHNVEEENFFLCLGSGLVYYISQALFQLFSQKLKREKNILPFRQKLKPIFGPNIKFELDFIKYKKKLSKNFKKWAKLSP